MSPARTKVLGRGTIDNPGHPLHGAKVDLLNYAAGGDAIVRVREEHPGYKVRV